MLSKKLQSIVIATMLITPFSLSFQNVGFKDLSFKINSNIAHAAVIDTSRWVRYTADYPSNPTFEQLKAASIDAPDYILCKTNLDGTPSKPEEYNIDLSLLTQYGWNGNLYYKNTINYGLTMDDFYKVLYVQPSDYTGSDPRVKVTYYHALYSNNDLMGASVNTLDVGVTQQFKDNITTFYTNNKPIPPISTTTKIRLGGASRIDTSIAIANNFANTNVDNIIITTGYNFPDSLSASVLAKRLNAPILLAGTSDQDQKIIDFIKTHIGTNGKVTVIGGTGAINDDLVNKIKPYVSSVERIGGQDRYNTNNLINSNLNVSTGTPIVIATGEDFPDALSISSIAAAKGYPIVLSSKNGLSQDSIDYINTVKPTQIYVAGGSSVVSNDILKTLGSYTITRLAGQDRYETSFKIADYFKNDLSTTVTIATGKDFPDALSGAVLAAKENAPILLVDKTLDNNKINYILNKKVDKAIIFGDVSAVSKDIEDEIQ